MGLLIAGAVSGDLKLVYVSIGLAALALLMLIVGVMVWRDEIFGPAASKEPSPSRVAAAHTELVPAGAAGASAAADAAQAARLAGRRAADGESARRRGGGETAAASSARTGSGRSSHRPSDRAATPGGTRVAPVIRSG